ncbi:hypothetical protein H0H92_014996 [Tricholoma furcatifolium]|nr:hypothetical protein H0H92_014996 [Tricholoma furcatifolium]
MSFARLATRASTLPRFAWTAPRVHRQLIQRAAFSAQAGLSREAVQSRVFEVLKGFEKVNAEKLAVTSKFAEDLGLDSLDQVEVVMAVEEEFAIEIPDEEADAITTVEQAIDYVVQTPEAH